MRQIAESCDMSIGNLYNYIKSKEDVLYLAVDDVLQRQLHVIDKNYDLSDPVQALRDAIYDTYTLVDNLQDYVLFIYQEAKNLPSSYLNPVLDANRQFAKKFETMLIDGIEKGIFRADIDPFLVSQNIVTLGHMWSFRRWVLKNVYTFQLFLERQLDYLFAAIINQKNMNATQMKDQAD
jgi:AcrR family transcriptional regulator